MSNLYAKTMNNLTKNLPLLLCFTLLTFLSHAQVEKVQYKPTPMKALDKTTPVTKPDYSQPSNLPSDFPKYVDTGNSTQDIENYKAAKSVWYANNPERAKQFIGNSSEKISFTNDEFQALPEKRKAHVLAHPELYIIK